MFTLVYEGYNQIKKVEIVHAGKEIFDELHYVEAHVWAECRVDGKGFCGRKYDNPGSFFVYVKDGWVFVPEGKFPEIIAFGRNLFNL